MSIEIKGDFSNEEGLNAKLIRELYKVEDKAKKKLRISLFGTLLEIIAVGYGWYHFGWHMIIVIFLLLQATRIRIANE